MLMDTGGNAGSQSSVTIVRSMALDELHPRDIGKVIWKELRVAVILALCLSAVCFGKLMLLDGLLFGYAYTWDICLVVSLALFATVLLSKLVGSIMPIVAKACKLDPAVVASPFITTIVDALSLIVYCQIALAILPAI